MICDNDCRLLTHDEIIWVLNHTNLCNLGISEHDRPYVVPLHYTFCENHGTLTFTIQSIHCGLKMRGIGCNKYVCLEVVTPVKNGYASVIVFGIATVTCIGVDNCYNKREEIKIISTDVTGRLVCFN